MTTHLSSIVNAIETDNSLSIASTSHIVTRYEVVQLCMQNTVMGVHLELCKSNRKDLLQLQ